MELDIVDVTRSEDADGEPRVNLGDKASGVGTAAKVAQWGPGPAFVSIPNAPDSTGCTQALQFTQGNMRCAIATRDNRYDDRLGALGLGDAAIQSNCDAGLVLRCADNRITLKSTNMVVTLDGAAGTITIAKEDASIVVSESGGVMVSWSQGPISASCSVSPGSVSLSYVNGPPGIISIGAGGAIAVVAPGGFTVNGVPVP